MQVWESEAVRAPGTLLLNSVRSGPVLSLAEGPTFPGPGTWVCAGAELLACFSGLRSRCLRLPLGDDAVWREERRGLSCVALL